MVKKICAAVLALTTGCGTILNSGTARVSLPPGAMIDGVQGPVMVSQQSSHDITYPDGRHCYVESHIGAGYVIADIILLFLVGLLVDAATGDWRTLNADACPGVMVD